VVLVPLAIAFTWRIALMGAGALAFGVLAVLWLNRATWHCRRCREVAGSASRASQVEGSFDFLRIPAVWMCFGFFFFYAVVLSAIQAFAPEAARQLHGVPVALAAMCLTVYMVCSAGGMVLGGFLAADRRDASG
jgi:predicted MFS family arabinose efflux permease